MNEMATIPAPKETETNRPMLDAWRLSGDLLIQTCTACKHINSFPRGMCAHCWSDCLEWQTSSGNAKIESFSVIYKPVDESFAGELPVVLATVNLFEERSILSRIICEHADQIDQVTIGQSVELARNCDRGRYPLPVFKPTAPAVEFRE